VIDIHVPRLLLEIPSIRHFFSFYFYTFTNYHDAASEEGRS